MEQIFSWVGFWGVFCLNKYIIIFGYLCMILRSRGVGMIVFIWIGSIRGYLELLKFCIYEKNNFMEYLNYDYDIQV